MAEQFANDAQTTLGGAVTDSDASLTVALAAAFPPAPQIRIRVDAELMLVTALSGTGNTQWAVTRGHEGTAAAAHAAGAAVFQVLTAGVLTDLAAPRTTAGIGDSQVTYPKIPDVSAAARVLGRKTAGAGVVEELTLSETLDFVGSAAQGDVLFRGASGWSRLPAGTAGLFLKTQGAGADPVWASPGDLIVLRDDKTQNTGGGTFTSGAWRTRDLNTEAVDVGGHCSLSSNQFTLAAGTYEIWASAPAFNVYRHQTRLQNVTDGATTLLGTSEVAGATDTTATRSLVVGRFTIASAKAFEVQHQCQQTFGTQGFGIEANFTTETYTVVVLRKVG